MVDEQYCVEAFGDPGRVIFELVRPFVGAPDIVLAPPPNLERKAGRACFWTVIQSVQAIPADGRSDGHGGSAMSRYGLFQGNALELITGPIVLRLPHHDAAPRANIARHYVEHTISARVTEELAERMKQLLRDLGLPLQTDTPRLGLDRYLAHELSLTLLMAMYDILDGHQLNFAPLLSMWSRGTIPYVIDEQILYVICDMAACPQPA